jgi:hypothetical protein
MQRHDYEMIKVILDKADNHGWGYNRTSLMMDLEFINDSIPLDFEKLARFNTFDFAHDIHGIYRNFNRVTKEMDNWVFSRDSQSFIVQMTCHDKRFPVVVHVDNMHEADQFAIHFFG